MKNNTDFRSVVMRLGILLTLLSLIALPSTAGTLFSGTINPALATPTDAGTYAAGLTVNVLVTGSVNLLGNGDGTYVTNPDGSLISPLAGNCGAITTTCFTAMYEYVNAIAPYPIANGQGDGMNHFVGGGANYDLLNPNHFAAEGAPTTDTTDPGAIRFGALAYTFATNPTATDWHVLVGANGVGTLSTGSGGTLRLVVVDTWYPNDTGGYNVTLFTNDVPEPAAAWLMVSGIGLFGLVRVFRRRRAC